MKLKKLLKYLDPGTRVKIWTPEDEDDDPRFDGYAMDIPWYLVEYYLYNDVDGEAIDIRPNSESVYVPTMFLTVRETKENE